MTVESSGAFIVSTGLVGDGGAQAACVACSISTSSCRWRERRSCFARAAKAPYCSGVRRIVTRRGAEASPAASGPGRASTRRVSITACACLVRHTRHSGAGARCRWGTGCPQAGQGWTGRGAGEAGTRPPSHETCHLDVVLSAAASRILGGMATPSPIDVARVEDVTTEHLGGASRFELAAFRMAAVGEQLDERATERDALTEGRIGDRAAGLRRSEEQHPPVTAGGYQRAIGPDGGRRPERCAGIEVEKPLAVAGVDR